MAKPFDSVTFDRILNECPHVFHLRSDARGQRGLARLHMFVGYMAELEGTDPEEGRCVSGDGLGVLLVRSEQNGNTVDNYLMVAFDGMLHYDDVTPMRQGVIGAWRRFNGRPVGEDM